MSPQNEQPSTKPPQESENPPHFLDISPETEARHEAWTKRVIADTVAARARKGLIRSDHLPKPQ